MALISFGFIPVAGFDASPCEVQLTASFTGSYDGDTFDCYTDGWVVDSLNAGTGFSGSWVDYKLYVRIYGLDTFESYSSGSSVNGLDGGTEWSGSWVDYTLG
jgi:hypothetical protein